jgi:hypothetical protein
MCPALDGQVGRDVERPSVPTTTLGGDEETGGLGSALAYPTIVDDFHLGPQALETIGELVALGFASADDEEMRLAHPDHLEP